MRLGRRALLQAAPALLLPGARVLAEDAAAPRRGGTIRVASPAAKTLDPLRMQSSGAIAIVQQVAEYLVWVEPDLTLRPVLATGWQTPDEGRSWIFEIRRGVRFHDGRELTADDVVASFRRLTDPQTASAGAAQIGFLKPAQVLKTGPYQVTFALDRPIGQFPYYTAIYNAVILPADFAGDFAAQPVGTGPFRLTAYQPQESAFFRRNEDYWRKGLPYLDAVEIDLYDSPQTMTLALQGEQADMVLGSSYLDALPLFNRPGIDLLSVPTAEHRQLSMRTSAKPFDDARVRRAVALAILRPPLVKGLLGGYADLGNDHSVAPMFGVPLEIPQRTRDLEEARRLLAAAGHPQGLDLELYTANYLELPYYAQFIKQMLEPAGIRVALRIEPVEIYYAHWTRVDFGLTDWASRPTPEQIMGAAFRSGAEWNQSDFRNARFDTLLDGIEAAVDAEERGRLCAEAAAILHEEVPAVIAYFDRTLRAVGRRVKGVEANAALSLDLSAAYLA